MRLVTIPWVFYGHRVQRRNGHREAEEVVSSVGKGRLCHLAV